MVIVPIQHNFSVYSHFLFIFCGAAKVVTAKINSSSVVTTFFTQPHLLQQRKVTEYQQKQQQQQVQQ